jgi:ribosome-binding protein aMBF1 (putative translation factor)
VQISTFWKAENLTTDFDIEAKSLQKLNSQPIGTNFSKYTTFLSPNSVSKKSSLIVKQRLDDTALKYYGEKIRKLRVNQKLSQSQLAFEINCTPRQIQRIERGGYNAGILYYKSIAEALSITISELLSESD